MLRCVYVYVCVNDQRRHTILRCGCELADKNFPKMYEWLDKVCHTLVI